MSRFVAAALAVAGLGGGLGCKEKRMEAANDPVVQCVGRFRLSVPRLMERAGTYRMQSVSLVETRPADPSPEAFDRAWAARVAAVAALREEHVRDRTARWNHDGEVFERRTFGPRFEGIRYLERGDGLSTWAALRDAGPVFLGLETNGLDTEKEAAAAFILALGTGYRPGATGAGPRQFALDFGAVDAPPGEEDADVLFRGLDVDFTFETAFTREPEQVSVLAKLGRAAIRVGISLTGRLTQVKHDGRRRVGGLVGEELIMREKSDDAPGGGRLYYGWTYPGRANDALRPRIDLKMETSAADQERKTALWNALLDSVRAPDAAG